MLRRLQNSNSLHRRTLSVLACAALLLHAAVPTGYMLDRDALTGTLTVVLCSGQGDLPVIRPAADPEQHAGHLDHQHSDKHDTAEGVCPFALAFTPMAELSATPTIDSIESTTELFIEYYSIALPTYAHSADLARGPPAHS